MVEKEQNRSTHLKVTDTVELSTKRYVDSWIKTMADADKKRASSRTDEKKASSRPASSLPPKAVPSTTLLPPADEANQVPSDQKKTESPAAPELPSQPIIETSSLVPKASPQ